MSDFIGRYLNKVDKKGRVSVPAGWRPSLISKDFSGIIAQSSLSEKAIDEIYSINFPEGKVIFDGTRAGDKTGDNLLSKLRIFIDLSLIHI